MYRDQSLHSVDSLCFSKDVLSDEHFDVTSFIEECKRRTSLDDVLNDVQKYTNTLQQELVELINRDYTDFVNLSSNLVGIDRIIESVRAPLQKILGEIDESLEFLDEYIGELDHKLEEKRGISERKECLEVFLSIARAISKLEELLHIDPETSAPLRDANILLSVDEETSKLIQRVGNDYNQLKHYISKAKDLPFVIKMGPRVEVIENCLQDGMDNLFKESLVSHNRDMLVNCLRTYAAIDRAGRAEELFREHVVQSRVDEIVLNARVDPRSSDAHEKLNGLFESLMSWIVNDCSVLLDVARGENSPEKFDFLGNSIWKEIVIVFEKSLSPLFSVGIADQFIRNYTVCMEFMKKMEKNFCTTSIEISTFRSHPYYSKFIKKWNLPIYFHLRFRSIAGCLEECLCESPPRFIKGPRATDDARDDDSSFFLDPTKQLWNGLIQCYAPGVYTRGLCHRFTRLAFQLLARYQRWLESGLDDGVDGDDVSSATPSWISLEDTDYCYLYSDVYRLCEDFNLEFLPILRKTLSSDALDPSLQGEVEKAFIHSVGNIKSCMDGLSVVLLRPVVERCERSLLPLRGITTTFRMTNKPAPTRPSYYVPSILESLRAFQSTTMMIRKEVLNGWMEHVVKEVCGTFQSMSSELLTNVRDTDRFLMKLRPTSSTSTSAEATSNMSDTDKIFLQLYLDVKAFGDQLGPLGLNKDEFDPYCSLVESVSEAEKLII